jgi:hypothetical protein
VDEARRERPGGIVGLHALISEHGEAIEADLRQHYGTRLADVGTRVTWRELRSLLTGLPAGSRLAVAEHGEAHQWSRVEWMLADLIDVIQAQRYEAKALQTPKGKSPGVAPQPYPRPTPDRAKQLQPALEQWRERHGQGV